ncbi:MAG: alpha-1,2-fucosyltransferase [Bacteroidota bacterium]|nr:alpha-1,2-fucosyltransferase [Bacteroidota bacterium]
MGLGNQMFQYAAGKSLALHKKVPLKLDVSSYEGYGLRKFELDAFFDLETEKATKDEVAQYQIKQPVKSVWNKILPNHRMHFYRMPYEEAAIKRNVLQLTELLAPSHKRRTYIEPNYHYNHHFFKAGNNVLLIGYWMSWRYFQHFENEIRQDFKIKTDLVTHLYDIRNEILKNNSVSIHIRRGDFMLRKNVQLHGIIPIDFYQKAIQEIARATTSVHLYVFSDDIEWARKNFKTTFPVTFVSSEVTQTAVEDFYLMSICKHNIIANSTFSWWAAFLNSNPDKIVVAPKKWYDKTMYDYKDVYPQSWLLL